MPRPTRWKGCVNGLKGRVRACFICPPIRLTSTPSKWPAPKLSSSCARLKRALWKHSMRRLLRPYKLFLRAMLKASSSMSDSVYDPYGNRYRNHGPIPRSGRAAWPGGCACSSDRGIFGELEAGRGCRSYDFAVLQFTGIYSVRECDVRHLFSSCARTPAAFPRLCHPALLLYPLTDSRPFGGEYRQRRFTRLG